MKIIKVNKIIDVIVGNEYIIGDFLNTIDIVRVVGAPITRMIDGIASCKIPTIRIRDGMPIDVPVGKLYKIVKGEGEGEDYE